VCPVLLRSEKMISVVIFKEAISELEDVIIKGYSPGKKIENLKTTWINNIIIT
jgi:hypothetical protein